MVLDLRDSVLAAHAFALFRADALRATVRTEDLCGRWAGDKIAIVYTGLENLAGGKTMKTFDVVTKSSDAPVATKKAKPSAADLI